MKFRLLAVTILILSGLYLSRYLSQSYAHANATAAQGKMAPWLLKNSKPGKAVEALVVMYEQADLQQANKLPSKEAKGRFVQDALLRQATNSQADLLAWLTSNEIEHRAFYIVNAIWVRTTPELLANIAARNDVERIDANPTIKNNFNPKLSAEEVEEAAQTLVRERQAALAPLAIEPGVTHTRAPEVWSQGFTGQGIVIGGADTGIRWNHNALKNQYRGWDGSAASHDFNWHDSIHNSVGNPCGNDTTAPCDDDGHGTHTIGSAIGTDGSTNQIGVAPGAKWIGCRNMDNGNGTPARYIECMEWFLAPYPIGGTPAQGDVTKAPDITTNSWGCPASEGCSANSLQAAVEAQRAAGIMMVVAAGNEGPGCSTTADPPSFHEASYTVGAFSAGTGTLASFSSRGPATADGSNRTKPDITAPGVSVRSALSTSNTSYGSLSGTSMATPHVAGAIALLWSAVPSLQNQIQSTINILNTAAVDVSSTSCSSSGVPNNLYGWGRLDIKAAVDAAIASNCTYTTSTNSLVVTGTSTAAAFNLITGGACNWAVISNSSWITVNGNSSGAGNATINLNIAANTGATRTGSVTVNSVNVSVIQAANNLTQDTDNDGIPDSVEVIEGTNLNVKDNDLFALTPKGNRLLIMQLYRDFLGREGEANGINNWVNALNNNALNRVQVVEAFYNSQEFEITTAPVVRLYFAAFLRIPDYSGLTNWVNAYRGGTPLSSIAQSFASSSEFIQTYGALDNTQYVTLLYNNILGRSPDPAGLAHWVTLLNNMTFTRGEVLLGFSESPEYHQTSNNKVFTVMIYVAMLRRAPEQAGFDNWVGYLNNGNSRQMMINDFLAATEYRNRFLP